MNRSNTTNTNRTSRFSMAIASGATKIAKPFRRLITTDPRAEATATSSAALVSGEWIFVSSCSGYHPQTREISPLIEEQTEQIFRNINAALLEAGASMRDVVRVRYVLVDTKEWRDCGPVLRRWLGDVRPAFSVIQAGLLDEFMRIEVEVTARKTGFGGFAAD